MAGRQPTIDPELKAHREWLGYLQPVGLVVAPAAMLEADWIVTRSGSELLQRQERYREALTPLNGADDADDNDVEHGFLALWDLLSEHLGWNPGDLEQSPETIAAYNKELPELGETLAPTAVVPAATGDGAQLLVVELPARAAMDQKFAAGEQLWRASAQERLERLLRETGVEAGLLFNGSHLRLVVAPKGESSGHLTFRLSDLAEVSGRMMFSGLNLLLGQSHVFLDPDGRRLADVLKKSRSFQAVVSNALADQVLAALWDLLRGFQQADELSQRQDVELLGDLPERDPQQLYGGLITVLMRLVFLLYAEDEALMPSDEVYELNYKVSGIFEQLQQDESEYPDTMEQRFGAWAGLMSLCRLVFDGGGPTTDYLPARHGQLFDPTVYPWLETPWVSDGVVLAVLRNLLIVNGERISYRALDVEQIGSVYEGVMGYAVRRIPGRCIGLKSKPQGAKKQLTTAVDLDALLALPGHKRKAWLVEEADTTLPEQAAAALEKASSEAELMEALVSRINRGLFDGPQTAGSLVFQTTEERRRSGSHYTPRSLTRPIVEEALSSWLERYKQRPTAAQILDLKICDPAMGSGAFLVESCRFLGEQLEDAWTREGLPEALRPGGHAHGEEPLIYARRLIAQSCLYGVDKNPFAVNLARLSLWLVSLSKNTPFTFIDHLIKCGDSLIGASSKEIDSFTKEVQINLFDYEEEFFAGTAKRRSAFSGNDTRDDKAYTDKSFLLYQQEKAYDPIRQAGDLICAAMLQSSSQEDARSTAQAHLAILKDSDSDAGANDTVERIKHDLYSRLQCRPFHWEIEFPEVFMQHKGGFDAFIGNPPFVGGSLISASTSKPYERALKRMAGGHKGRIDLCFYFNLRSSSLMGEYGYTVLINTSSIAEGQNILAVRKFLPNARIENKRAWPGDAQLEVVDFKNPKCEQPTKTDKKSRCAGAAGSEERAKINPKMCFRGIELRGKGFEVDAEYVRYISEFEPESKILIKPYFSGSILNSWTPGKFHDFCIDANHLSHEAMKARHPKILERLERTVLPARNKIKGRLHEKYYWRHYDKRTSEFAQLSSDQPFFVKARDSDKRCWQFIDLPRESLINSKVIIFKFEHSFPKGVLQSLIHKAWCEKDGSFIGNAFTYNPTLCLETFPFPPLSDKIAKAWDNFSSIRDQLMNERALSLGHIAEIISRDNANDLEEQLQNAYAELNRLVLQQYQLGQFYGDLKHRIDSDGNPAFDFSESAKNEINERLLLVSRLYYSDANNNPALSLLCDGKPSAGQASSVPPSDLLGTGCDDVVANSPDTQQMGLAL